MVGWHHWFSGHQFEQTPGDGEGQGSLVCWGPWGHKESDTTERPNNSNTVPMVCTRQSQLPDNPPSPHGVHTLFSHLSLYFCVTCKIIYTIFLDFSYVHLYTVFVFLFLTGVYLLMWRESGLEKGFPNLTDYCNCLEYSFEGRKFQAPPQAGFSRSRLESRKRNVNKSP